MESILRHRLGRTAPRRCTGRRARRTRREETDPRSRRRFAELPTMLAAAGDNAETPIPVAIETPRGLLVAALRNRPAGLRDQPDGRGPLPRPARGRPARSPTPPTQWSWPTSCAPTRTLHRPCPPTATSPAPSRSWPAPTRTPSGAARASNQLRSLLREYYPAVPRRLRHRSNAPTWSPRSPAVLAIAPTPPPAAPADARPGSPPRCAAGRQRGIDAAADQIHGRSAQPRSANPRWSRRPRPQTLALLGRSDAACAHVDQLGRSRHRRPSPAPGLRDLPASRAGDPGARVLAESATTDPLHRRPRTQGLRRFRTRHPGLRPQHLHHPPPDQERPPRRRRLRLGLRQHRPTRRHASTTTDADATR